MLVSNNKATTKTIEELMINFLLPGRKTNKAPKAIREPVRILLMYALKNQPDQPASTTKYSMYSAFLLESQPAAIITIAAVILRSIFIKI